MYVAKVMFKGVNDCVLVVFMLCEICWISGTLAMVLAKQLPNAFHINIQLRVHAVQSPAAQPARAAAVYPAGESTFKATSSM